jgi:hypothetical protein
MPVVPMKQTISVTSATGLDEWGEPIESAPVMHKCRIDEGTIAVRSKTGGLSRDGEVVVAEARILLDKLVSIGYDDEISFTNELGTTITRNPKEINVKRNIAGKPILTEVIV